MSERPGPKRRAICPHGWFVPRTDRVRSGDCMTPECNPIPEEHPDGR